MRDYELTIIVDPDLALEKQKKLREKIKKSLIDLEGKITKEDEWGRKQFAYPINHKELGYYFFWEFELAEKSLKQFESEVKLEDGILRFLLVKRQTKGGGKKPDLLKNKSKVLKHGTKSA